METNKPLTIQFGALAPPKDYYIYCEWRCDMNHTEKAAQALSDLNVFNAILAILESGCLHPESYGDSVKMMILTCQNEMAKCGRRYDEHMEKVRGNP